MTTASRRARVKAACWLPSLAAALLVACGDLTSSPREPPDPSPGGDSSTAPAGPTPGGGSATTSGGTSGGVTLVTTTAGTTSGNPPPYPGTAGEGGSPDYPATVRLCIADEEIPENWGQGGQGAVSVGSAECAVGVLGGFNYMGCLYELLDTVPRNVDVFVGGHAPCCYASKLLACK